MLDTVALTLERQQFEIDFLRIYIPLGVSVLPNQVVWNWTFAAKFRWLLAPHHYRVNHAVETPSP